MDKATFFLEATQRLCSSLDLSIGMKNLFNYLKTFMPVRSCSIGNAMGAIDASPQIIHVSDELNYSRITSFLDVPTRKLVKLLSPNIYNATMVLSAKHPLYQIFSNSIYMPEIPFFMVRLSDKGQYVGGCNFCCYPDKLFSEEEQTLLASLEPILCFAFNSQLQYTALNKTKATILQENRQLKQTILETEDKEIIGSETGLRFVNSKIQSIAPSDAAVLITGETGTGKELAARSIHNLSQRAKKPFVALNCGALSESFIDSELFGYNKGAFTGANNNYKGRFERANGGTLFLDEVGELPLTLQTRLLRVLQEKEIEPLGSSKAVKIDVRIIAATNRDLLDMVQSGSFRRDLYYRLRIVHVYIPPLRERRQDIPALIEHFLFKFIKNKSEVFNTIPQKNILQLLAQGELEKLMNYPWYGNIRELENVILEAVLCTEYDKKIYVNLDSYHFDLINFEANNSLYADIKTKVHDQVGLYNKSNGYDELNSSLFLKPNIEVEKQFYQQILDSCGGKIKGKDGAAKKLNIAVSTLRYKLNKLEINFGRKQN